MKITKRVRDLPPGEYAIPIGCDVCAHPIMYRRMSDCKWVTTENGEQIMACCCSIKCAKAFIKTKENERVPSAT